MKWTTTTTYVDHETGEELNKKYIDKGIYIKVKCNTKYKYNEKGTSERNNIWQCRKQNQLKLF